MEDGIGQLKCRGSWNRKKEKKRKNENSMQMCLCMTYHDMLSLHAELRDMIKRCCIEGQEELAVALWLCNPSCAKSL